jgi:hypothetical protein
MEEQELIERLARAQWAHRQQTPWGQYSQLEGWEAQSDGQHEELYDEVRAILKALEEAGFSITPK